MAESLYITYIFRFWQSNCSKLKIVFLPAIISVLLLKAMLSVTVTMNTLLVTFCIHAIALKVKACLNFR